MINSFDIGEKIIGILEKDNKNISKKKTKLIKTMSGCLVPILFNIDDCLKMNSNNFNNLNYYKIHCLLIDNCYKFINLVEGMIDLFEIKINLKKTKEIKIFLDLRKYWIHPLTIRGTEYTNKYKKENVYIQPIYQRTKSINWNQILVMKGQLKDDWTIEDETEVFNCFDIVENVIECLVGKLDYIDKELVLKNI